MSKERYEIRGKIGQGGVGAVYRAFDRNLNREVAIKRVLTEEGFDANDEEDGATKALLKEATALCSVQHPHIVTVYDAGVDEDGPYVVMELLSGRTLDEMVERGTMTWVDFRETAVQSLEALIAAQDLNLVHRDIKPSNVMVTWLPSGKFQVKLVDFGLAKFSAKPSLQTIDHGDAVFGSIHFMAPEQFERVPLDQRTDMYSLGCVYFFCLSGHYPFDGETAPQVMAAHLQNEYTPLREYRPDLPDWLCQWVEWHIALKQDDRPNNAREALKRFLAFEQPADAGAPAAVQAVPASSLAMENNSSGDSKNLTGPVPIHQTGPVPASSAAGKAKTETGRAKLLTGAVSDSVLSQKETGPTSAKAATPQVETGAQPTLGPPPAAQPTNLPHAVAGQEVKQVKGKSQGIKVAIAAVLGVAVIITAVLLSSALGGKKDEEGLLDLMKLAAKPTTTEVIMTEEQVDLLLAKAAKLDFDKDKGLIYQTLFLAKTVDGTDVDGKIAEFATTKRLSEQVRQKLFQVLKRRESPNVVDSLLTFATRSTENKSVVAALDATGKNLRESNLSVLIELIATSESSDIRRAAEKGAKRLVEAEKGNSSVSEALARAFKNALEAAPRQAFLRVLGAAGGSEAARVISDALESDDTATRISAFAALQGGGNPATFNQLYGAATKEKNPQVRGTAFESLLSYSKNSTDLSPDDQRKMWTKVASNLRDSGEKRKFIAAIATVRTSWAAFLVRPLTSDADDDVSFRAEKALQVLEN